MSSTVRAVKRPFKQPDMPGVPGPSQQLLSLYEAQKQQIEQQKAMSQRMGNVQMGALGFKKDPETGEWVARELTGETLGAYTRSQEIRKLLQERQLSALGGELEVSPALEKRLAEEERIERAEIQAGPGLNSTTGQQRLSNLQERHELIRETARRGDITALEGLLGQRTGLGLQRRGQTIAGLGGVGQFKQQSFRDVMTGYSQASAPWLQQQQARYSLLGQQYGGALQRSQWIRSAAIGAAAGFALGGGKGAAAGGVLASQGGGGGASPSPGATQYQQYPYQAAPQQTSYVI